MKIAMVGNSASIFLQQWSRSLSEKGLQIVLISPTENSIQGIKLIYFPGGVTLKYLPMRLFQHLQSVQAARHIINRVNPDILHLHGATPYSYYFSLTAPRRIPQVLSLWGSDILVGASQSLRKRFVAKSILKKASVVTAESQYLLEAAGSITPIKEKQCLLPWGIDTETFKPIRGDRAELCRELGLPNEMQLFLSPRHAKPVYQVKMIVQAFLTALRHRDDIHLIVILGLGDPSYFQELKSLVDKQGATKYFSFLDEPLTSSEMAKLFNVCKVFFSVPSTDSLSRTILEGLACGSIPIIRDLPAYRGLKDKGGYIIWVRNEKELTDAILEVADLNIAPGMLGANRKVAMSFPTWEQSVKQMVNIYRSLI